MAVFQDILINKANGNDSTTQPFFSSRHVFTRETNKGKLTMQQTERNSLQQKHQQDSIKNLSFTIQIHLFTKNTLGRLNLQSIPSFQGNA